MNKKNIYRLKIGFFMLFLVGVDQVSKYLANNHLNGKNELINCHVHNFYYNCNFCYKHFHEKYLWAYC